jgi:ABC-2 type transport system permease protein
MNLEHFGTFVWLRWRLAVNQMRRAGMVNFIFLVVLLVLAALVGLALCGSLFVLGLQDFIAGRPIVLLGIWDGLVVGFLFFWMTGLLAELQRSELLSLDRLLHLPVSLQSAFVLNYLASLVSGTLVVFLPAFAGFALGVLIGRGPIMLIVFPLLASFLLMVTALTYQFRGWLAAMMVNPRKRRSVLVIVTMAFVLIAQTPNLINLYGPWRRHNDKAAPLPSRQNVEQTALLVSAVLPPGWLGYGAMAAAQGRVAPALVATAVFTLVGLVSLRRAYVTTLRLYTGSYSAARRPRPKTAPAPAVAGPRVTMLDRELPWLPEHAAAVALASFRSLTRAPEARMMLLTPVIMVAVFGSMVLTSSNAPPEEARPFIAAGAMAIVLLSVSQLVTNQFGFDRAGFRVFVLCAAPRRDILLGKNLAFAPLALGLGSVMAIVIQVLSPVGIAQFLALWPVMLSMYLVFCMMANLLSIHAPMAIAAGSMRPANMRGAVILLQLVFTIALPFALAPTMLPLLVELLVAELWSVTGLPISLVLALLELGLVAVVYHYVLRSEGRLLQRRERRILEIVAGRAE